jgi:hypothetical protein
MAMWWNRHMRVRIKLVNHPPFENPGLGRKQMPLVTISIVQSFPVAWRMWTDGVWWELCGTVSQKYAGYLY